VRWWREIVRGMGEGRGSVEEVVEIGRAKERVFLVQRLY
jgi:hypothetical protein